MLADPPAAYVFYVQSDLPILCAPVVKHEHQLVVGVNHRFMVLLKIHLVIHEARHQGRFATLSRSKHQNIVISAFVVR